MWAVWILDVSKRISDLEEYLLVKKLIKVGDSCHFGIAENRTYYWQQNMEIFTLIIYECFE